MKIKLAPRPGTIDEIKRRLVILLEKEPPPNTEEHEAWDFAVQDLIDWLEKTRKEEGMPERTSGPIDIS